MRELIIIAILIGVLIFGGIFAWRRFEAQESTIRDLNKRIEEQTALAASAVRVAEENAKSQTIIIRERDRAREEITTAVGAGEVVPLDVWRATRGSIERMRREAGEDPAVADRGHVSPNPD